MPRIENTLVEDAVADSLLGPELEVQAPEETPEGDSVFSDSVDLLNAAVDEQYADPVKFGEGAENRNRYAPREEEEAPEQSEQEQEPQESAAREQSHAQQPSTPEQIEAGIEALGQTIEQHQLNDPASAKEFATDFCETFGTDIYQSGINVEALGGVMAKTTLSALNAYQSVQGDPSRLAEMPAESAKAFAYDVLKAMGTDPRSVRVNERLLADTAFRGTLNFIDTYTRYGGKVTDMAKLNDPQAAEMFLGNFLGALGLNGPVDRATALKFADTCGKYVLSFLGKVSQIQQRSSAGEGKRSTRARSGGRGQRVAGGARNIGRTEFAPRFKTNSDLFTASVVDAATVKNL